MFDLIDECGKEIKGKNYTIDTHFRYQISCAKFNVKTDLQVKEFSLCKGEHYLFYAPLLHVAGEESENYLAVQIATAFKKMLKSKGYNKQSRVLIACLGNPNIQADMLGKVVFDKTNSFCLENANIFKICPNIGLFTGIQSGDLIKMIVKCEKIDIVVMIDSLATSSLDRLGKTVQLVSGGMTPGSGVNRFGQAVDEKFLATKCVSIGAPFLINSCNFVPEKDEVLLCCKDVAENIDRIGTVISSALGKVLI